MEGSRAGLVMLLLMLLCPWRSSMRNTLNRVPFWAHWKSRHAGTVSWVTRRARRSGRRERDDDDRHRSSASQRMVGARADRAPRTVLRAAAAAVALYGQARRSARPPLNQR